MVVKSHEHLLLLISQFRSGMLLSGRIECEEGSGCDYTLSTQAVNYGRGTKGVPTHKEASTSKKAHGKASGKLTQVSRLGSQVTSVLDYLVEGVMCLRSLVRGMSAYEHDRRRLGAELPEREGRVVCHPWRSPLGARV